MHHWSLWRKFEIWTNHFCLFLKSYLLVNHPLHVRQRYDNLLIRQLPKITMMYILLAKTIMCGYQKSIRTIVWSTPDRWIKSHNIIFIHHHSYKTLLEKAIPILDLLFQLRKVNKCAFQWYIWQQNVSLWHQSMLVPAKDMTARIYLENQIINNQKMTRKTEECSFQNTDHVWLKSAALIII